MLTKIPAEKVGKHVALAPVDRSEHLASAIVIIYAPGSALSVNASAGSKLVFTTSKQKNKLCNR